MVVNFKYLYSLILGTIYHKFLFKFNRFTHTGSNLISYSLIDAEFRIMGVLSAQEISGENQ
jgi:hypothetical protein